MLVSFALTAISQGIFDQGNRRLIRLNGNAQQGLLSSVETDVPREA